MAVKVRQQKNTTKPPLWKGPEVDGVTFSMINKWLSCRERFRIYTIEGLEPVREFNHRIEYGNMFHLCEDIYHKTQNLKAVFGELSRYCHDLLDKYPSSREEIDKWYNVCYNQYPVYLDFWGMKKQRERNNIFSERVFRTPYKLVSGRTVYLKGKTDCCDLVTSGKLKGVWIGETKTKGEVDEEAITRQVSFDLQTMLYVIANLQESNVANAGRFRGVRYNVIRRPLSGGKGTIRHKKTETKKQYYERLRKYITDEPETYFSRWDIDISPEDILKFEVTCFQPILENLCDWYDEVTFTPHWSLRNKKYQNYRTPMNWRHPFGLRNMIDEYGWQDVDYYLDTGDTTGLCSVESLTPELDMVA